MKLWILSALVAWQGTVLLVAAQRTTSALCVGIGAARIPSEELPWQSRFCPAARADAEAAFRELVPGAEGKTHLYTHPIRWGDVGVLLTDGVTDNRSIPVSSRILHEGRELVAAAAGGEVIFWLAGIGEVAGAESWIYDRMGSVLSVASVLNELPADARVIVRTYANEDVPVAHTLYICDEASAEALRERSGDQGPVLPGLGWLLETVTPVRLDRLREQLAVTGDRDEKRVWMDLGRSLERMEQDVTLAVDVRERPVFKKERRAGPFFTIVEVETDEVIGMQINVDLARLQRELTDQRLAGAVVEDIVKRVEDGAAASFREEFAVGANTYTLAYDKGAREVRIRYLD